MNLSLNKKLTGGFLFVASLAMAVGLIGLFGLNQSAQALKDIRDDVQKRGEFLVAATDGARSAQVNFKIQVQEWKNVLLRGNDPAKFDKYFSKFEETEAEVQRDLDVLESLLRANGVPVGMVEETRLLHAELGEKYREALQSYAKDDALSYRVVDKLVSGIDREPTRKFDEIVEMVDAFEAAVAGERELAFQASNHRLFVGTSIGIVVVVSLAIFIGTWIGRSTSKQVQQFAEELGGSSEFVERASSQVSGYSQNLADSINSEAAAIQEASASLQVLNENSQRDAETARKASDIANRTRHAVDGGKHQMVSMQEAMGDIRESSDGISHILKSIDEIAFQTNILALNAAVEAARAGEAGAGFAVVADEVRGLAQRCAKAARETSERIDDSIEKSRRGIEISARVSDSLEEILQKAQEVDSLVSTIADSAERNRQGVAQVSAAITQIEASSQANAAVTEESAVASQELSQQADQLGAVVIRLGSMAGIQVERRSVASGTVPTKPRGALSSTNGIRPEVASFSDWN